MKKKLCLLLSLALAFSLAAAQAAPLAQAPALAGQALYPEGASEETAVFRFSYAYPQFVAEFETDEAINEFYSYQYSDMLLFTAPLMAQAAMEEADAVTQNTVSYQITHNGDDYLCLLFSQEQLAGAAQYETWTAHVFARQGAAAGTVVTLPEILGTLDSAEEDEAAIERASRKANELVCALVWEIIQEQISQGQGDYYEELTADDLAAEFYPESDFYMDADGSLVFFIQPGMIASQAQGILTFPFTLAELQSEL